MGRSHSKNGRKRMITDEFPCMLQGIELPKSLLPDKDSIHLPESLGISVELLQASPPLNNYFHPHMLVVVFHIGCRFRRLATPCDRADKALGAFAFVAAAWSISARGLVMQDLTFCDPSWRDTTSVIGCRSRPSNQSKKLASISKAFCSPSLTSLYIFGLIFFILDHP